MTQKLTKHERRVRLVVNARDMRACDCSKLWHPEGTVK